MNSRIPAYPLITIDPYFSIWSRNDCLYEGDTSLWTGHKKCLYGYVYVDKKKFRFMGEGKGEVITQMRVKTDFLNNVYEFENKQIKLTVDFWGTHFLDDFSLLSVPASFISFSVTSKDGRKHEIKVELLMDKNFTYDKKKKPITVTRKILSGRTLVGMGQTEQTPLIVSGDHITADWGTYYIYGKEADADKKLLILNGLCASESFDVSGSEAYSGYFIVGYDDGYSLEYFGEKLKGYWTKSFADIDGAILRLSLDYEKLLIKRDEWNNRLTGDVTSNFGENYLKLLRTAFRQVLAAHKLVEDKEGKLLYMSKECHSNGCINTVDVSYPSVPLFLLYSPELVYAMLNGIFRFSGSRVWAFDYAPHDMGRYPIANGQVYAYRRDYKEFKKDNHIRIFEQDSSVYDFERQMPVEECGNMLIMSYAYLFFGGKKENLEGEYEKLKKWADYLVKAGVILENQLCTDDFAGHSEKNVNLAIKSVVALACFSKLSEILKKSTGEKDYFKIASENARQLVNLSKENDYLTFAIGKKDSWSQKYNMVWDLIFGFNLFDIALYKGESGKYSEKMNRYGLPLDYRSHYSKTDWFMWVSVFDGKTDEYAEKLVKFLEHTKDRDPFTDYYSTVSANEKSFAHRSVQGGLWMPVLVKKGE